MKELTEQERKRIEQLELRRTKDALEIEWIKDPFPTEKLGPGNVWRDITPPGWLEGEEYRRKPAPRFVPWTREDASIWRGLWVRIKSNKMEVVIERFAPSDETLYLAGGWFNFERLFEACEQIDGTPCGKQQI